MEPIQSENAEVINLRIPPEAKNLKVFLVLILVLVGACNRGTDFNETVKMADDSWHKDSLLVFDPVVNDTSRVVNIGFSLEHTANYPYSNLWLFVGVKSPGGQVQKDTIEYFLAEPDGKWIGKGNDASRTLYWLYKRGVKLAHPGEYIFTVQQGMRRDSLAGVKSFSLWIEEAEAP